MCLSSVFLRNVFLSMLVVALLVCATAKPVTSKPSSFVAVSSSTSPIVTHSVTDLPDQSESFSDPSTPYPVSFPPISLTMTTESSTLNNTSMPTTTSSPSGAAMPVKTIAIVSVLAVLVVGALSFCLVMRVRNRRKLAEAEKAGRRVTRYFQRPTSIFARPSSLFRPRSVVVSDGATKRSLQPPPDARPRMSMFHGNEGGRFSMWLGGRDSGSKHSLGQRSIQKSRSNLHVDDDNNNDNNTLVPPKPGFAAESNHLQPPKNNQLLYYDKF